MSLRSFTTDVLQFFTALAILTLVGTLWLYGVWWVLYSLARMVGAAA